MAKKLLLDVLVNVLGNYVEGLSSDNLRVGVWSGKVELSNLKLKSTALDTLNLPIKISHGALKHLKLKVPWSHLESKPVHVVIDGVYLQCGPLDVSSLTTEELRSRVLAGKRERLKAAMEAVLQANQDPTSTDVQQIARQASYIQQLLAKIVHNIEITLTNVHIRYEDTSTIPGKTFSAGITLETVSLVTTDDKWVERFVDEIKLLDATAHKLGRMTNLGLYWSTRSDKFGSLDPETWERAMQQCIYSASDSTNPLNPTGKSALTPEKHVGRHSAPSTPKSSSKQSHSQSEGIQHLLALPNSMTVKLTLTENPRENVPKFDVEIDIAHLGFSVDEKQYRQIMATSARFGQLDRQKQMALHRPEQRPTFNPRAWWHYAYKLVTGNELSFRKKVDDMLLVLRSKARYIALVKLVHTGETEKSDSAASLAKLDAELSVLEDTLPMVSLLVFRQLAALQIAEELMAKRAHGAMTASVAGMSSYISNMFSFGKKASSSSSKSSQKKSGSLSGSSAANADGSLEDDDEALMARIQSTLTQAEAVAVDNFTLRLCFASSAKLDITSGMTVIATAQLAMAADLEIHAKRINMAYTLSDLSIEDKCTLNPLSRYIVIARKDLGASGSISDLTSLEAAAPAGALTPSRLRHSSSKSGQLSNAADRQGAAVVSLEIKEGMSVLHLSSLPLELTWNHDCIQKLLKFFTATDAGPDASLGTITPSPLLGTSMNRFAIENALPSAGSFEITIQIHAPKIIIPEDSRLDKGCLLLDSGFLTINGSMETKGMRWDISLAQVNVGMPLSYADRYRQVKAGEVSAYLVKPFDIRTLVQNFDTTYADLTIDIRIAPSISTELDAGKINRLIRTLSGITDSLQGDDHEMSAGQPATTASNLVGFGDARGSDGIISTSLQSQKAKIPSDRRHVALKIQLPAINVDLSVTPAHVVVLAVTTLDMEIVTRPFDSKVIFKLNSLSLLDPFRHPSQQYIIHTVTSSRRTHLITLVYCTVSNTLSPFYCGYGTELQMEFAQMSLNIDPNAVLRLKPLLEALTDTQADTSREKSSIHSLQYDHRNDDATREEDEIEKERGFDDKRAPSVHPIGSPGHYPPPLPSTAQVAPKSTGLPGIKLLVSVDRISVDLMRSQRVAQPNRHSSPSKQFPTKGVLQAGAAHLIDTDAEINEQREPDANRSSAIELLEVSYSLELTGMASEIQILQQTEVKLFLESFDIVDRRSISDKYKYKSLLCRSTIAAEHSSAGKAKSTHDISRGRADSVLGDSRNNTFSLQGDNSDQERLQRSIFYLLYKEETAHRTTIELALKDVTSFIAVDSIVDMVSVVMENVDAVAILLDVLSAHTKELAAAAAMRAGAVAVQAASKIRSGSVYVVSDSQLPKLGHSLDRTRTRSVSHSHVDKRHLKAWTKGSKKDTGSMDAIPEGDEVSSPLTQQPDINPDQSTDEANDSIVLNHPDAHAVQEDDSFVLHVIVKVENPRLIFLEKPEDIDSKAIVGRCGIHIHYCNDIRHRSTGETKEKLQVSLHSAEVFVLTGMHQGFPQQVIEPTGMELLLNRTIEQGIELAVGLSVDVERVSGRISFHDLELVKSILARASLAVNEANTRTRDRRDSGIDVSSDDESGSNVSSDRERTRSRSIRGRTWSTVSDEDKESHGAHAPRHKHPRAAQQQPATSSEPNLKTPAPIQHLTMYDISIHCGRVSIIAIDDSDNKNLPVARIAVDLAIFQATGASIQVSGVGSMVLQAEHYNTAVAVWEPIVERWQPTIRLSRDAMTTSLEIQCDEMVFVNVSGAMTKSISRAMNLLSLVRGERGGGRETVQARHKYHPFILHNELGVPVDIFDSLSTKKLISLRETDNTPLPPTNKQSSSSRSVQRIDQFSSTVDVRLCGQLSNLRLPLFQLPLNINTVRPYYLQPSTNPNQPNTPRGNMHSLQSAGGPIVEECYENERFDLVKGWSKPWTIMGDPQHWSDKLSQVSRERTSVTLPSERWEWVDKNWSVDMSGQVGKDIDEGGWEYATSFAAFTLSKSRRSKQPLDSVRRRRWVRCRALKANLDTSDATRPLTLYWDVSLQPNGSRAVRIRSGLLIRNDLPFPIEVLIGTGNEITQVADRKGWKQKTQGEIFGPVAEGDTLSLPLLSSHATNLRIRPHKESFPNPNPMEPPPSLDWSEPIDCRQRAADSKGDIVHRTSLVCETRGPGGDAVAPAVVQPLTMRATFCQKRDLSRWIIISPLAVIINRLPCQVAYRCKSLSAKIGSKNPNPRSEQGVLSPGVGQHKLLYVDLAQASLSIKLGNFAWSSPMLVLDLPQGGSLASMIGFEESRIINLPLSPALADSQTSHDPGQITIIVSVSSEYLISVVMYSRHAMLDTTGLQMSIKCFKLLNSAENQDLAMPTLPFDEDILENPQRQVSTRPTYNLPSLSANNSDISWAHGGNGLVLFQSAGNKVALGVKQDKAWVDGISLVVLSGGKIPFQIIDPTSKRAYLLAYFMSPLGGLRSQLWQTQLLTTIPAYVVVNCMEQGLELRQAGVGGSHILVIAPGCSAGWHVTNREVGSGTAVHLRTDSTSWSLGSIDLNDIGTSIVILPSRAGSDMPSTNTGSDATPSRSLLAHIEVKFAEPSDHAYITIVVWRQTMGQASQVSEPSTGTSSPPKSGQKSTKDEARSRGQSISGVPHENYVSLNHKTGKPNPSPTKNPTGFTIVPADAELSVRNDTDLPITLQQAGINFKAFGYESSQFEICVPPRSWVPFGWADPTVGSMAIASVGTHLGGDAIIEMIDLLRVGEITVLDLSHFGFAREEVVIRVVALGVGKVLHATRQNRLTKEQLQLKQSLALLRQPHNYIIKLSIAAFSLSVVAERPKRREFASFCLQGLEARILHTGTSAFFKSSTSYELKLIDVVADNFAESAVYPIMLDSRASSDKRKILEARKQRKEQILRNQRSRNRETLRDKDGSLIDVNENRSVSSEATSRTGSKSGFTDDATSLNESQVGDDEELEGIEDDPSSLDAHFFILLAVQEVPLYTSTVIFRQVAVRMLELSVMLDTSTLQLYLVDLHNDLIGATTPSTTYTGTPHTGTASTPYTGAPYTGTSSALIEDLNSSMLQSAAGAFTSSLINAFQAHTAAQRHKVYFESFVMHPLKLKLSITSTPYPSSRPPHEDILSQKSYRTLRLAKSLLNINELVVKMSSFAFTSAMESIGSLTSRVAAKIAEDLKSHILQTFGRLVGGLSVIGKPAGLYKNIGSGVQGFFYEPYQGLMQSPSPKGLAVGAAKGTTKLFAGFAAGVVSSTANIVGSATKGVAKGSSYLSGDKNYRVSRDERRRTMNASGGGMKQGVKAGAESVLAGFKSGFQGLVTKPFEEGQKSGALGFLKGVGLGLAGALTKPVVGISDGIGMAATGLSNRMNNVQAVEHLRPARAFARAPTDHTALILVCWDAHMAAAQEYILTRAAKYGYYDEFAAYVALGGDPLTHRSIASRSFGSVIISLERVIRMADGDTEVVAVYPISSISHILFKDCDENEAVGVELVVYNKNQEEEKGMGLHLNHDVIGSGTLGTIQGANSQGNSEFLKCATREIAVELYTHLALCGPKMGNPSSIIPVNIATKSAQPTTPTPVPIPGSRNAKGWKNKIVEVLQPIDNEGMPGGLVGVEGVGVGVRGWNYQFGSANKNPFTKGNWGENEVLQRGATRLLREMRGSQSVQDQDRGRDGEDGDSVAVLGMDDAHHQMVDERVWQLVCEWTSTHTAFNTSRCLALIILNHSPNPIYILRVDVVEGKNYVLMGSGVGNQYDSETRGVMPGGAVVLFAYAFRPSLVDLAHVTIGMQTGAFTAQVSSRRDRTDCRPVGGFTAGYLEKSLAEVWGKFVLLVT